MEYVTKREKYTVGEFYKRNKGKLPLIVMATQSFGGINQAEALDYVQVIRIHSVCRNQRVTAVQLNQLGTQECTYSFPVNNPIQFFFDENLNQNEKKSLSLTEILGKKTLPVDVHFARKGLVNIGDNTFSTSHFSTLRLTNVSEEIYLLGNYIFDDELDLKIVQIPIHLSTIQFSEITGLKGKTKSVWEAFQRKFDGKAAQLNFDVVSGNPSKEIAKTKSDGVSREVDSDQEDSLLYENCQHSMHTHIRASMKKVKAVHFETENTEEGNIYEVMAPVPLDRASKDMTKIDHTKNKPNDTNQMIQAEYAILNVVGKLTDPFEKGSTSRKKTDSSAIPQILRPKPKHSSHEDAVDFLQKEQNPTKRVPYIAVGDAPPPELRYLPECKLSGTNREKILSTSVSDSYENVQIGKVWPTPNAKLSGFNKLNVKEKSYCIVFQKTLDEGVTQSDLDAVSGNPAKYKSDGARREADDEGENSSLEYENFQTKTNTNARAIRGKIRTSPSETASTDNDDLYETMMISPGSDLQGFIQE